MRDVPQKLKGRSLNIWLGSYFNYPPDSFTDSSKVNSEEFLSIALSRLGNMNPVRSSILDMDKEGTYGPIEVDLDGHDKYGQGDRACGYTPYAAETEAAILRGIALGVLNRTASNVLFKQHENQHHRHIPIGAIFCENSAFLCIYAGMKMKEGVEKLKKEGVDDARLVKVHFVQNANHFVSQTSLTGPGSDARYLVSLGRSFQILGLG